MIKKLLLPIFEKLMDIIFILSVLGVLVYAVRMAMAWNSVFLFFIVLIGGLIFTILSFGVIYILLDIRSELKQQRSSAIGAE